MKNSKLLSESVKIDIALTSQSLNGPGTGPYYKLDKYGKALFVWEVGAQGTGVTSIGQVMQAQNAAGTGAKPITNNAATITSAAGAQSVLIDNTAIHVADDTYTINGLTFTAAAADGGATSRTYAVGANVGACSANLAAKINDSVIGVPGVTASVSGNDVLLVVDEDVLITVTTSAGAQGVPVTQRAIGYVECDASFLDLVGGFTHVALRVTNSAATQTGAIMLRGQGRFSPVQKVAASKVNVNP